jgi:hypothetical protein
MGHSAGIRPKVAGLGAGAASSSITGFARAAPPYSHVH